MPFITETVLLLLWAYKHKRWWELLEKVILVIAFFLFSLGWLYVGYHKPMTLIFFEYPLMLNGITAELRTGLWS